MKHTKLISGLVLLFVLLLAVFLAPVAQAEIASGVWGEVAWVIDDSGLLTISAGQLPNPTAQNPAPWRAHAASIKQVVVNPGVKTGTSAASLFQGLNQATSINASGLDTSQATTLSYLFQGCTKLSTLNVTGFNLNKVTSLNSTFQSCGSSTAPVDITGLKTWNTGNVQLMSNTFRYSFYKSLGDIQNWDLRNTTDLNSFLYGTTITAQEKLDLSNWNVSKVRSFHYAFNSLTIYDYSIKGWNPNLTTPTSMVVSYAFGGNMTRLELTAWNNLGYTPYQLPQYQYQLPWGVYPQVVQLNPNFKFYPGDGFNASPPNNDEYTGLWQAVGSGTEDAPMGDAFTLDELRALYSGTAPLGPQETYVWQKRVVTTEITGKKVWVGDTQAQRSPIYLMVAERVQDATGAYQLIVPTNVDLTPVYGAVEVDLSLTEFTHTFTGLPLTKDDGTPIDYTIVEAQNPVGIKRGTLYDYNFAAPLGYLRTTEKLQDGTIVITNTRQADYEPVKDGDNSTPCEIDWFSNNIRDRMSNVEPTRYKVSSTYFAFEESHASKPSEGFLVVQAWPSDNWRAFTWRTVLGTNNEVHNGVVTVDFSKLRALGMVVRKGANGRYLQYNSVEIDQGWISTRSGLDFAYRNRYTVIDMNTVTESLSDDGNTLTVTFPTLNAFSAAIFSINTSLDSALTPVQDYFLVPMDGQNLAGTRYEVSSTFKAQTRCVHVEKNWLGQTDGSEEAVVQLTVDGAPIIDKAREELQNHLGTSFADQAPDQTQGYQEMMAWINGIDQIVPGFFSAMAQNPSTPMDYRLWVNTQVNPNVNLNYSYTFDQAEFDAVLGLMEGYYQVTLSQANGYEHTFGQLPWLTPEAYSLVETQVPEGWQQVGEITRELNDWRVLLGVSNQKTLDIVATKTWSGGPANDHTAVNLILSRQVPGGTPEALDLAPDTITGSAPQFTYTWLNLPTTDTQGNVYTYSVAEALAVDGEAVVNGNNYQVTQSGFNITNTYVAPPATPTPESTTVIPDPATPVPTYPTLNVPLAVNKVFKNGTLKGGEFTFQLLDSSGRLLAEAQNAADGTVSFPDRTFSKVVTNYLYTIREVPGTATGVTYDSTVYTLKISTRPVNGLLQATVAIEKDGVPFVGSITFTNQRKLPQTGDSAFNTIGFILLIAVTLLGSFWFLGKKRQKAN